MLITPKNILEGIKWRATWTTMRSSCSLSLPVANATASRKYTMFSLRSFVVALSALLCAARTVPRAEEARSSKDVTVLVLGGGVAGVIAARTLHESGIQDFVIVEALGQLGGRMMDFTFGAPGKELVLEAGCNWVSLTRYSSR